LKRIGERVRVGVYIDKPCSKVSDSPKLLNFSIGPKSPLYPNAFTVPIVIGDHDFFHRKLV
jgi:hypothetical protein